MQMAFYHCNFFSYISYKTTFFQNFNPKLKFLPTKARTYKKFSVNILKYLFEAHILIILNLNTNLIYLSLLKVLSLYICIVFLSSKFSFVFNS
jgi:hypothetical protein